MSEPDQNRITELLNGMNEGDDRAWEELVQLIDRVLRRMARSIIRKGKPDPLIQTTQMVDDAYLKLVDRKHQNWKNRKHFYCTASLAMRRIWVGIARKNKALKRGGDREQVPMEEWMLTFEIEFTDLCDLSAVIDKIHEMDHSWGQIVDLRFFGGFTMEEIAEILNISLDSVEYKWDVARAWLRRELKDYDQHDS